MTAGSAGKCSPCLQRRKRGAESGRDRPEAARSRVWPSWAQASSLPRRAEELHAAFWFCVLIIKVERVCGLRKWKNRGQEPGVNTSQVSCRGRSGATRLPPPGPGPGTAHIPQARTAWPPVPDPTGPAMLISPQFSRLARGHGGPGASKAVVCWVLRTVSAGGSPPVPWGSPTLCP